MPGMRLVRKKAENRPVLLCTARFIIMSRVIRQPHDQETALSDTTSESPETWPEQHGSALYRFAMLRLRDADKAEEVVQDTLVAALQAHARFNGGASVRTWLIGILKHKIMDQFRHEAREAPLESPDLVSADNDLFADEDFFDANGSWREKVSDWGNPEDSLERSQLIAILQRCLDALPERLFHFATAGRPRVSSGRFAAAARLLRLCGAPHKADYVDTSIMRT